MTIILLASLALLFEQGTYGEAVIPEALNNAELNLVAVLDERNIQELESIRLEMMRYSNCDAIEYTVRILQYEEYNIYWFSNSISEPDECEHPLFEIKYYCSASGCSEYENSYDD